MPEYKQPACRTNSQLSHSAYRKIKRVLSFRRRVFGQHLEETMVYERRYGERLAPLVVEQCVAFIRQRGLLEVGLFRQPGQATLVKELQVAFDSGEKPPFDSSTDVHTVASLLKLYLRELPEPVVPFCHYQDFLMCGKGAPGGRKQALEDLKKLLHKLPTPNFNLLHYICRFLNEVQSYSHINKMSVENLATVFGPNILRPKAEDPESIIGETLTPLWVSSRFPAKDRETTSPSPRRRSRTPPPPPRRPERKGSALVLGTPGPLLRRPPPCRVEMELRPPPHQTSSPRRMSDPLYDNCPTAGTSRAGEGGGSGGRVSAGSSSSQEGPVGRNAHESTLSVYDNLEVPAPTGASDAPAPQEDSGDSSSWSSCEIVLEEAKPGFGPFPFRAEPPDPPPDFFPVQTFLSPAAPDQDPTASATAMRYLLKQQIAQQKEDYETQIRRILLTVPEFPYTAPVSFRQQDLCTCRNVSPEDASLEKRNESLQGEVSSLRVNLEQHRRWYKVAEIKMRNAERARSDADRRNTALQQEMEQFFDTFGELNHEAKKTERIVQSF
ncbi:hypothetical protein SKAU_G00365170 [Synaphobranchus kaupii]|uniref:Rho-GAP domain-containing protein n=1 Tax=Synaphobranchus kaupii TaxID=118154 RepID=A0A9Q1EEY3_SYNKA|nr:hypothetical protein SKAU_G00365170 [Synaphobranchus kaupii]